MNKSDWLKKLAIAFAFGLITYLICFLLPPRYLATESYYFPLEKSPTSSLGALGIAHGSNGDPGSVSLLNNALDTPLPGTAPETAAGILGSYFVLHSVVTDLQLDQVWKCSEKAAFLHLKSGLAVEVDSSTNFLNVSFNDPDRELALKIVGEAQRLLIQQSNALSVNIGKANREFIGNQLTRAQRNLKSAEGKLVHVGSKSLYASGDVLFKSYITEREKLTDAQATLASSTTELKSLTRALNDYYAKGGAELSAGSSGAGAANSELAVLSSELATRKLALEDALSTFTATSPQVKLANKSNQSAQKVVAGLNDRLLAGVAGQYDPQLVHVYAQQRALKSTVDVYQGALNQILQEVVEAPKQGTALDAVKAEYARAESEVTALNAQYELARIAEIRDPSRFEVLDGAHIDPSYSFPRKGIIAGSVFAVVFLIQLLPALRKLVND